MKPWEESALKGKEAAKLVDLSKVDPLQLLMTMRPYPNHDIRNVLFATGYLTNCVERYREMLLTAGLLNPPGTPPRPGL